MANLCRAYIYQGENEKALNFLDSICGIAECDHCNKVYIKNYILMKDSIKTLQIYDSTELGSLFAFDRFAIQSWQGEKDEVIRTAKISADIIINRKLKYGLNTGNPLVSYYALFEDHDIFLCRLSRFLSLRLGDNHESIRIEVTYHHYDH